MSYDLEYQNIKDGLESAPIKEKHMWEVVSAWFAEKGLVSQQIDSYNRFLEHTLEEIFKNQDTIVVRGNEHIDPNSGAMVHEEHRISFEGFSKPELRTDPDSKDGAQPRVLTPFECRMRNLTYSARINLKYSYELFLHERGVEPRRAGASKGTACIGEIPVMLKSSICYLTQQTDNRVGVRERMIKALECPWDDGGYFIVKGSEKVIITQEGMRRNHVFIFKGRPGDTYSYRGEIHSIRPGGTRAMTTLRMELLAKSHNGAPVGAIMISLPYVSSSIPLFVVFKALNFITDQGIVDHIIYDPTDSEMFELLMPSMIHAASITTETGALDYIGRRCTRRGVGETPEAQRRGLARDILAKHVLPHIGDYGIDSFPKAFFIGYAVRQMLMCSLGRRPADDRDHIGNKRLQMSGTLLSHLFRILAARFSNNIRLSAERQVQNHTNMLSGGSKGKLSASVIADAQHTPPISIRSLLEGQKDFVTNKLSYAFATGNWSVDREAEGKTGVSQVLARQTYMSALSHLRRLQSPLTTDSENPMPRILHNTQYGFLCPCETPEGRSCGLVKNLSLMCYVTDGSATATVGEVLDILETWPNLVDVSSASIEDKNTGTMIFLDGRCVGFLPPSNPTNYMGLDDFGSFQDEDEYPAEEGNLDVNHGINPADQLEQNLRARRRDGSIAPDISIVHDRQKKEIRICTDEGRMCRPLLIVERGRYLTDPTLDPEDTYENVDIRLRPKDILKLKNQRKLGAHIPAQTSQSTVSWNYLLRKGIIEYLDPEEEESALIIVDMPTLRAQQKKAHEIAVSNLQAKIELAKKNTHPIMPALPTSQNAEKSESDDFLDGFGDEETKIIPPQPQIEKTDIAVSETFVLPIWTHCEIHPAMMLGALASIIPFPDHNQSPRNTYQCAMGKQAIGVYASNFAHRMDTSTMVLHYPQIPLLCTHPMKHLYFRELPAGQNSIVAIACYSGYNQEDSVIMNHGSVDRGLFRATFFRTSTTEESNHARHGHERFCHPNPTTCDGVHPNDPHFANIEEDGLTSPGVAVNPYDVLVGKTCPLYASEISAGQFSAFTERNASLAMRSTENGRVDAVMLSTNNDGDKIARVRVRSERIPQVGDKFSSRHGQKGTIGMLFEQADMPFTPLGINPDIIINPHAIPSRMTIGQLIECLYSKVASIAGLTKADATPFASTKKHKVDQIAEELHKLGFQKYGNEMMINGQSGEMLNARVFIGPTYYQRLKHMVIDKIHARPRGEITMATRSPMEGRSRGGGLKIGNMERDCLIAHGAGAVIRDRFLNCSDKYLAYFCEVCGGFAYMDQKINTTFCPQCRKYCVGVPLYVPFAFHLFLMEMAGMGISPRLFVQRA